MATTKRAPAFSKDMLLRIAKNESASTADFLERCCKRRTLAKPVDAELAPEFESEETPE